MSARAWSPLTLLLFAACTSSNNAGDGGPRDAPRDDAPDAASDVTTEDVPMDVAPDVAVDVTSGDAGGCVIPGYGTCAPSSTCVIARCPDGTPVSCFCTADSMPRCTGACPPLDGGMGGTIECGGARGLTSPPACAPTRAVLDPQICRCILGYAWDGARCQSLANCHCYEHCEEVFPTREACEAAYATCLDGGR